MADLDTLRPEVREAIAYCDGIFDDADNGEWAIIRAELLRLAKIEEERWAVVATRNGALERAEKAETELAALKWRVQDGIVLDVDDLARGHAGLPSEWLGRRVRLLVED